MAGSYLHTAKRLQTACRKQFGVKLLINSRQWYSDDKDMAMTMYIIQRVDIDPDGNRKNIELFKTYSQIQLLLFMRDYWYKLNGWEVPTDNERWEAIKKKYEQEQVPSNIEPTKGATSDRRYSINADRAEIC